MNRVSASDYTKAKKQNTIYSGLKYNAYNFKTVNPIKTTLGYQTTYNNNINILLNNNCAIGDCSGGQLNYAKSYDLLYDFNEGKHYNYNRCQCKTSGTDTCATYGKCDTSGNCCLCFTCAFK